MNREDRLRMGRRMRSFVVLSLAVWALITLAWVLLLVAEKNGGCPGFDQSGGKPGHSAWQWLPPGRECVYFADDQTHVDAPPDARFGEVLVLLAWPAVPLGVARIAALDRADDQQLERSTVEA